MRSVNLVSSYPYVPDEKVAHSNGLDYAVVPVVLGVVGAIALGGMSMVYGDHLTYLDLEMEILYFERTYSEGSDILVYRIGVYNNGYDILSGSVATIDMLVDRSPEPGDEVWHDARAYNASDTGPFGSSECPTDNPDIFPGDSWVWRMCFEGVPWDARPTYLRIGDGYGSYHIVQVHSDVYVECADMFESHLCAYYILEEVGPGTHPIRPGTWAYMETDDPVYYGVRLWLMENEPYIIGEYGSLRFLEDVAIVFDECGEANASYTPYSYTITMCYELVVHITEQHRETLGTEIVAPTLRWIFMHELGHAVIHQYDLPITGSEEDAADQFATIMLLNEGFPGMTGILGMAAIYVQQDGYQPVWGVHSLDSQRYYNMICLAYGKYLDDPEMGVGFLRESIPENRVIHCPGEYDRAQTAWDALLAEYRG